MIDNRQIAMQNQTQYFNMHGIPRIYTDIITKYLGYFPCVAIIGARQSGKTTLLKQLATDWNLYDLENAGDFNYVSGDPDLFFRLNSQKVGIDEAQMLPSLFPALRVAIDADRQNKGRFIITGSSSPDLISSISESLAGRVGIVEISPFLISEVSPTSHGLFYELFSTPAPFKDIAHSLTEGVPLEFIHEFWFRGGYPEPWLENKPDFSEAWLAQYVRTYIERDISRLFPGLNRQRFLRFIEILAGVSGTVINCSDVARTLSVSQPTVRDYFQIAHGTLVWRNIPSYEKNVKKRIIKHPKGYLRDTGLLHFLNRIRDLRHLLTHTSMGLSWESLVIEQLIKSMEARGMDFDYYYYRTSSGAEVDLILEGNFGLVPIEIKYTSNPKKSDINNIKLFMNEHNCPFGIVITNGEKVIQYAENLFGIPFAFCI